MNEQWRRVPRFPSYEVSDLGRVRHARLGRARRGSMRARMPGGRGPVVSLRAGQRHYDRSVAVLVLTAFVGAPEPANQRPGHRDGDVRNCELGNLEWVLPRSRAALSWHDLRAVARERHAYSEALVAGVARVLENGRASKSEIAERAGFSRGVVHAIARRSRNLTLTSFVQLAAGLGMKPSRLMEMAEALGELG